MPSIRIFAVSDIHGHASAVDSLSTYSRSDYDYLLIAGDIGDVDLIKRLLDVIDYSKTFVVPGNNETKEMEQLLEPVLIHKRRVDIKHGLNVVGVGYSTPTPWGTPGEMDEEGFSSTLSNVLIDEHSILLTHSPPYGILDTVGSKFDDGTHIGSKALLNAVEKHNPLIHLFGHVHEKTGCRVLNKTLFINIPPAMDGMKAIIDINLNNGEGDPVVSVSFARL